MISYTVGFRKVISQLQGMLGLVCTAGQSPDFALFQWGNRTFENSRKPNRYSRLSYIKICNCNTYMGMIYAKGRSSNVNFFFFAFSPTFFVNFFFCFGEGGRYRYSSIRSFSLTLWTPINDSFQEKKVFEKVREKNKSDPSKYQCRNSYVYIFRALFSLMYQKPSRVFLSNLYWLAVPN